MAYRRRRLTRRKPVFRRRRRFLRRRRRRPRSGNLFCKLTKVSSYTVDSSTNNIWDGSFKLSDFPEHVALEKNFESVKLYKVRVTVLPMQNVSNNTTSVVTGYVMCPWHYPIDLPKQFNDYLSSDKAKLYRQTQVGRQTYVPNIMLCNDISSASAPPQRATVDTMMWRPTLRTTHFGDSNTVPRIYAGIIAFQGDPSVGATKSHFNVKMDVWVQYKNQTRMNIV
nr:capsid protein [Cyclovirus sp.]